MSSQHDLWGNQQRPLGQQYNRQRPPVLPPPATLETGGQSFYPLPSLPSLGNGSGQGHSFNIPSISASVHIKPEPRSVGSLPPPSSLGISNHPQAQTSQQDALQQSTVPPAPGVPNRSPSTSIYRPLNVKDALSYLDQVKVQFYNQADVYNNFLDIMKDFKSQRGYPNLIQGFNTFLPPGYRIECSLDPTDPNTIRVTTPRGTTTRSNLDNKSGSWNTIDVTNANGVVGGQTSGLLILSERGFQPGGAPGQHAGALLQSSQESGNGGQIEFNHAISYVNKIKTRFANQPDIYKHFLEILQTYQREQKPIGEVYEQVTALFANSPDLLDDFKQFLPDTSNQAQFPQAHTLDGAQAATFDNGLSQLPPVGNFHASPSNRNVAGVASPNRHQSQFPPVDENTGYSAYDRSKKPSISEASRYEENYNQESQYSNLRSGLTQKRRDGKNGSLVTNPTLVPGIPEPVPPITSVKTSSLLEELSFFDKVKKAIGNKQAYTEFLKILNIFSQDIIDKNTLVERVQGFIGDNHPDLMIWFKMFVGWQEPTEHIEDITFKKHQLELSLCKAYGPSYRQLPKAETFMPCSGRDEMCWEVLNDEWVGHPTWASEDSGFIAHRKNQYEEILFKIEEERLEFDYNMEANLRTIQVLETIANRIANMTLEQKASFKLPDGLGHNSHTIYKKVIRKVYDKDRGFEVIDALHENPAIAVPIVLKRLKQKDEEWKRSQREWHKVWREMEQKVFFKSLDHLGLTFKQADKKLLTTKQMVSEINTVKMEQQNKRLHPLTPMPQEQLNYEFLDEEVIFDVLRLSEVYIQRSPTNSANDREKLSKFFRDFIALFFRIPVDRIEAALASRSKSAEDDSTKASEAAIEEEQDFSTGEALPSKKRRRDVDLLKDVLKKRSKLKDDEPEGAANEGKTSSEFEHGSQELINEIDVSEDLWIQANTTTEKKEDPMGAQPRDKYNLICNTTIYVFFRHFRTLYERLEEIKKMSPSVGKEISSRKIPQFADDLNLTSHQLTDMNIEILGDKDCYQQVLDMSERLIDGEIEQQWFEESLRQAFRNKAYKLYTVDKVIQSLTKHMHAIITDSRCSDMIVLFEGDKSKPIATAKDQILYRMLVRSLMSSDENMFKITVSESSKSVNIQFVGLDDLTINEHETADEEYNYYITSYIMSHATEGVPASKIRMPFSPSFLDSVEGEDCEGQVTSGLKVSVCQNSFRLFFEADTYDSFTSNSVYQNPVEVSLSRTEMVDSLKKIVDGADFGWELTLSEGQNAESFSSRANVLFKKGINAYNALAEEAEAEAKAKANVEQTGNEATNGNILPPAQETAIGEQPSSKEHEEVDDTTVEDNVTNQEESEVKDQIN